MEQQLDDVSIESRESGSKRYAMFVQLSAQMDAHHKRVFTALTELAGKAEEFLYFELAPPLANVIKMVGQKFAAMASRMLPNVSSD